MPGRHDHILKGQLAYPFNISQRALRSLLAEMSSLGTSRDGEQLIPTWIPGQKQLFISLVWASLNFGSQFQYQQLSWRSGQRKRLYMTHFLFSPVFHLFLHPFSALQHRAEILNSKSAVEFSVSG